MLYEQYFEKIESILGKVKETQGANIEQAAALIADAIKNDGILHMFGCGHSQMYAMEVFYRASGLVPINAILTPMLSLEPKAYYSTHGERQEGWAKVILDNETIGEHDVLFIASTSARNAVPIEMAMEAKKRGMKVILLYSKEFADSVSSRHPSGKKAQDFSDVVLDNCGVPGDGIMEIDGLNKKFGPTSSVIGFTILQSIVVQVIENLVKANCTPPIWVSANLDEGDKVNAEYLKEYRLRVSCL